MSENENLGGRPRRRIRRGGLVGPVILVGLGIVLLLNSLGVVDWSIWGLLVRMWPLVLIAIGLDLLIGRRSAWGSLLVLVLVVAVLVGGVWLYTVGVASRGPAEEFSQALEGATEAEVVIARGAGTLYVEAHSEPDTLAKGQIHVVSGEDVTQEFSVVGGKATFSLRSEGPEAFAPFGAGGGAGGGWTVGLSSDVPLDLEISLGVGQSDVDLTGLTVRRLNVSTAVGQTRVTLPAEDRLQAQIDGAVGETIILLPAGVAARVELDAGLAARQIPAGYEREGDVYTSPDYWTADSRVDLQVNQAIGAVTIRQLGGE